MFFIKLKFKEWTLIYYWNNFYLVIIKIIYISNTLVAAMDWKVIGEWYALKTRSVATPQENVAYFCTYQYTHFGTFCIAGHFWKASSSWALCLGAYCFCIVIRCWTTHSLLLILFLILLSPMVHSSCHQLITPENSIISNVRATSILEKVNALYSTQLIIINCTIARINRI